MTGIRCHRRASVKSRFWFEFTGAGSPGARPGSSTSIPGFHRITHTTAGPRAVLGSQQPRTPRGAHTNSGVRVQTKALRAEDGSRSVHLDGGGTHCVQLSAYIHYYCVIFLGNPAVRKRADSMSITRGTPNIFSRIGVQSGSARSELDTSAGNASMTESY